MTKDLFKFDATVPEDLMAKTYKWADLIGDDVNQFLDMLRVKYGKETIDHDTCLILGLGIYAFAGAKPVNHCRVGGNINGNMLPAIMALSIRACALSAQKLHGKKYQDAAAELLLATTAHLPLMDVSGEENLEHHP